MRTRMGEASHPPTFPKLPSPNVVISRPTYVVGVCPACKDRVALSPLVLFSDDAVIGCDSCGSNTPRHRLILEGLAVNDTLVWGFFASDIALQHGAEAQLGAPVLYELPQPTKAVAKWGHWEARPADLRYAATLSFTDDSAFLWLNELLPGSNPNQGVATRVHVEWTRFGVSSLDKVPAWRQSLYAAATLVSTNPSAAVVLIAAGFEAFFNDVARIRWKENQLDPAGFTRMSARNLPITSLVEWLPEAVGMPSFKSAPNGLHARWDKLVNQRRNSVVHRATVHMSSEEARESLRAALECCAYLDPHALVRPHPYYLQ